MNKSIIMIDYYSVRVLPDIFTDIGIYLIMLENTIS